MKRLYYIVAILFLMTSCYQEQTIPVQIDVALQMSDAHTTPLAVTIDNQSKNASRERLCIA